MMVGFITQFTQLKKGVKKIKDFNGIRNHGRIYLNGKRGKSMGNGKKNVGAKKTNGFEVTDRVTVQVRFNFKFYFRVQR